MADATLVRETDSPDATRRLAFALGQALEPVPRAGITIALLGDLGAGKTVFVGGLCRGLGVPATTAVVSPTFTVARAYRGRVPIHHLDAYHLRGRGELEAAGFEEMGGNGRVTCVEWGDRIEDALPPDRLEVSIETLPPTHAAPATPPTEPHRRLTIRALGKVAARMLERLVATEAAAVASPDAGASVGAIPAPEGRRPRDARSAPEPGTGA